MSRFTVAADEPITLQRGPGLADLYTLSPFVWLADGTYHLLLRMVNRSDNAAEKVARVHYGRSADGLHFVMDDDPVIAPGPEDDDRDGVEDPTVQVADGRYHVFYSGWDQQRGRGHLLRAVGDDPRVLRKAGRVLAEPNDYANAKEPEFAPVPDGTWRMFFEYAADEASKVGSATAPTLEGPWTFGAPVLTARPDRWDAWHLSPGPILHADTDHPVMLYNGATRDAHWRIGWAQFDAACSAVVARGDEPVIVPPDVQGDDTDIAFVASAVQRDDDVLVYYSVSDKTLMRATVTEDAAG